MDVGYGYNGQAKQANAKKQDGMLSKLWNANGVELPGPVVQRRVQQTDPLDQ